VSVVGIVPTLSLDQLYMAIILDDPDADTSFILEGTLPPGTDMWVGPVDLSPRVCVQREFMLWGDGVAYVVFGIDSKDRAVGPIYFPPSPGTFKFVNYWVKRVVYVRLVNTDAVNSAEYHIIANTIQPTSKDWDTIWKPRIDAQAKALKGET
jgi:hypothetical protein